MRSKPPRAAQEPLASAAVRKLSPDLKMYNAPNPRGPQSPASFLLNFLLHRSSKQRTQCSHPIPRLLNNTVR